MAHFDTNVLIFNKKTNKPIKKPLPIFGEGLGRPSHGGAMKKQFITEDLEKLKTQLQRLPRLLGNEAVHFFQEQIDEQKDVKGKPYKQRPFETRKQSGKKILKDRHNLYDSIKILSITNKEIVIGVNEAEIPYAQAHNEGASIEISDKMRKFFWAMHYKLAGRGADADFYKNLALKKTPIIIPKRQFIGDSPELERRIEQAIVEALTSVHSQRGGARTKGQNKGLSK